MAEPETIHASTEAQTRAFGGELARRLSPGDIVLLDGPLGAGKTTFVRGLLESLGYDKEVRSPTFNLVQVFETQPPVMHADLFRVKSYVGIGIEDYLETHLCLIEWPDRAVGLVDRDAAWRVQIEFEDAGRVIRVQPPVIGESVTRVP
jgi:tRNA threonylcarbamoyladenosine biosynthesis protein TsaE